MIPLPLGAQACYNPFMRLILLCPALILALASACPAEAFPPTPVPSPVAPPVAAPSEPAPLDEVSREVEVLRLRQAMQREVPKLVTRTPAQDAQWIALARVETALSGFVPDRSQLLAVVDRNPRVQALAVVMAAPDVDWKVIGVAHVSTGSTGRFDHYVTPRGVFHVTDAILGFRAEGTENENGIRGLGAKGLRVWDFGWQRAMKGWAEAAGKPDSTPIRLMMHATDPDKLEQRIGQPASQGCIRLSTMLNRFLDLHGVLDSEYERVAATDGRFRALLLADRVPSPLAGNTLVVVDSAARPGSVDKLGDVAMATTGK
jgi:lipoprotein-anchoring transpeptidase ErfK/SrfK